MNVQIESLNIKLLMLLFILDRYTLLQCNKFIRALSDPKKLPVLAMTVTVENYVVAHVISSEFIPWYFHSKYVWSDLNELSSNHHAPYSVLVYTDPEL